MRPLRTRLQEARKRLGVPWEALERDYLMSWILAGIVRVDTLGASLAFKGGTALRKCYFGDYRLSEDLDFSAGPGAPRAEAMQRAIAEACGIATSLLNEYAATEIVCERYVEKTPHPGEQEAFAVRAQFPWHRRPQTRVMVEVTTDEPILRPVQPRVVVHDYGEPFEASVPVYALEEVLAEKLRAILQQAQKLRERGWGRSRARDYYDLWSVLGAYGGRMELSGFASLLAEKCAVRHVQFRGPDDFFQDAMLNHVRNTWDQWLGPLVSKLPSFEAVLGQLRPQIAALLQGT